MNGKDDSRRGGGGDLGRGQRRTLAAGRGMHCLCSLAVFVAAALATIAVSGADAALRAGAAAVDITPREFPLNMPGGFSANLADRAHDPLHSRALVLDDGTTALAMVVVDNLGVPPEVLVEAKRIAAEKTGILPERMLICSTHTHSGPPANATEGPAPTCRSAWCSG